MHTLMAPTRVLDTATTRDWLDAVALMRALEDAAHELADGRITCPARLVVPMAGGALLLSMPAVAHDLVAHKLITVVPGNAASGLPVIQGQVSAIDASRGHTLLQMDGPTVTGCRTAAVSMLALRALRAAPPRRVRVIGAGVQARHHIDALLRLYPQVQIGVSARSAASVSQLCAHYAAQVAPDDVSAAPDTVITCTTSRAPVYQDAARDDVVLIAVGAFQHDAAEIAAATVQGSAVFVDDPVGAQHEAGDLLLAGVEMGAVRSLSQLLREGPPAGRPLLFKSVGCAAWDLAAARVAVRRLAQETA